MTEELFDWDETMPVPEPLPRRFRLYKACVEDVDRFPKAAIRLMLVPAGTADIERVGFVPGDVFRKLHETAQETLTKLEACCKAGGSPTTEQRDEIAKLRQENAKLRGELENTKGVLNVRTMDLNYANQRLAQDVATLKNQLQLKGTRDETEHVRKVLKAAVEDRDMWVEIANEAAETWRRSKDAILDLQAKLNTARMMLASEADGLRAMNQKKRARKKP